MVSPCDCNAATAATPITAVAISQAADAVRMQVDQQRLAVVPARHLAHRGAHQGGHRLVVGIAYVIAAAALAVLALGQLVNAALSCQDVLLAMTGHGSILL